MCCDKEQDSGYGKAASGDDDTELVPLEGAKGHHLRSHEPHPGDEDQQEPDLRQFDASCV